MGKDPVDLAEVGTLIGSDPALTAALLAHANSARYGARMQITGISDAITRLGLKTVRDVVSASLMGSCFSKQQDVEELTACWRHTLATAIIANEIAEVVNLPRGTAYAAGLLHDLGRLALSRVYTQKYVSMMQEITEQYRDVVEEEKRLFGVEHTEAGRWLAEKWKLPPEFAFVAGRHHDRQETVSDLLGVVHVSCSLSSALGFGIVSQRFRNDADDCIPKSILDRLGRTPDDLRDMVLARIQPLESPMEAPPCEREPYVGTIPDRVKEPPVQRNSGLLSRLFG